MAYTRLITVPMPSLHGGENEGKLELARQLRGNNGDLTDVLLINPPEVPTHFALATDMHATSIIYMVDVTQMSFLLAGQEEGGKAYTNEAADR